MTSPGDAETGGYYRQAWKIVDQSFVAQGQFQKCPKPVRAVNRLPALTNVFKRKFILYEPTA